MRKIISSCLTISLLAGVAGIARAQTPETRLAFYADTPGWYGVAGFRYQSNNLPRFDTPVFHPADNSPLNRLSLRIDTFGPMAGFGYVFAPGALPAWIGANPRLELTGWWLAGEGSQRQTNARDDAAVTSLAGFFSGNAGQTIIQDVRVRATQDLFRLNLRAASDFSLGWGFTASPSFGVFGGQNVTDYKMRSQIYVVAQVPPFFINQENERLRTSEVGGNLGLRLAYEATPWLSVFARGQAGFAHKRVSYRGDDCFSITPNIDEAAACDGSFFVSSVSGRRQTVAFVGGWEGGIELHHFGPVALQLAGGAEYDSRVPSIRKPNLADLSPASIRFSATVNYHATLIARIRF